MAYLGQSELDKEKLEQQGGEQAPQLSGPSGVITGQAGSAPAQVGQPTKSGAFTNINQYINANRDQGQNLAENLGNKISTQADAASAQASGLQNQFNNQVEQNTVHRNQDFVKSAVAAPIDTVNSTDKYNQFAQMQNARYAGPNNLTDLGDFGKTQQDLNKAYQSVQDTKSEGGRFGLLQSNFGRPTYNRGQQRLDQMILQSGPEAKQTLQNVQDKYQGINSMLGNMVDTSTQRATQAKDETQQARNDVQDALFNEQSGALPQFQNNLDARVAQAKADAQTKYQGIQKAMQNGDFIDNDTLASLGMDDSNIGDFNKYMSESKQYGDNSQRRGPATPKFDFTKYLQGPNVDTLTRDTVANSDDYAKYAALAKLAGIDPAMLRDASLAGTGKANSLYDVGNMLADARIDMPEKKQEEEQHPLILPGMTWGTIGRGGSI